MDGIYFSIPSDEYYELLEIKERYKKERKRGRWIRNFYELANGIGVSLVTCDQCYSGEHGTMWNFCPNCGARMEASDD